MFSVWGRFRCRANKYTVCRVLQTLRLRRVPTRMSVCQGRLEYVPITGETC